MSISPMTGPGSIDYRRSGRVSPDGSERAGGGAAVAFAQHLMVASHETCKPAPPDVQQDVLNSVNLINGNVRDILKHHGATLSQSDWADVNQIGDTAKTIQNLVSGYSFPKKVVQWAETALAKAKPLADLGLDSGLANRSLIPINTFENPNPRALQLEDRKNINNAINKLKTVPTY